MPCPIITNNNNNNNNNKEGRKIGGAIIINVTLLTSWCMNIFSSGGSQIMKSSSMCFSLVVLKAGPQSLFHFIIGFFSELNISVLVMLL